MPSKVTRASNCRTITDGQSLNNYAVSYPGSPWPRRVGNGQNMLVANVAVSGEGWFTLLTCYRPRVTNWMDTCRNCVITMMGGSADIWSDHPAATCYADQVTYSNLVRSYATANNINLRIVGTTTTPATVFTAPQNTQLASLNSLVMADASNAYNYRVDLASDPRLSDPNNTTYYVDGVHPTSAGSAVLAELMRPAILTAMRSLGVSA